MNTTSNSISRLILTKYQLCGPVSDNELASSAGERWLRTRNSRRVQCVLLAWLSPHLAIRPFHRERVQAAAKSHPSGARIKIKPWTNTAWTRATTSKSRTPAPSAPRPNQWTGRSRKPSRSSYPNKMNRENCLLLNRLQAYPLPQMT